MVNNLGFGLFSGQKNRVNAVNNLNSSFTFFFFFGATMQFFIDQLFHIIGVFHLFLFVTQLL